MLITGVVTVIASEPDWAIWPETKVNTPWTTENAEVPLPESGSNTISSRTMRPFSSSENVDGSTNTMPTAPPPPVSSTSPWNTGEPTDKVTVEPSTRVAVTPPSAVSTEPMGSPSAASPAWAYCPGATGPANASARSGVMRAPPDVTRIGDARREEIAHQHRRAVVANQKKVGALAREVRIEQERAAGNLKLGCAGRIENHGRRLNNGAVRRLRGQSGLVAVDIADRRITTNKLRVVSGQLGTPSPPGDRASLRHHGAAGPHGKALQASHRVNLNGAKLAQICCLRGSNAALVHGPED